MNLAAGERNQRCLILRAEVGAGATRYCTIAGSSATDTYINIVGTPYMRYGILSDDNCSFAVEATIIDPVAGPWRTVFGAAVNAGVFESPYTLAAPMNQTGYVLIPWPVVRMSITNTSGTANVEVCAFFASE